MTPVCDRTVDTAIPLKPMPSQIPGMPNTRTGFKAILAKKAAICALCIDTVSPCDCSRPFRPNDMTNAGKARIRTRKYCVPASR